jgi:PAS domain-containing protein
VTAVIAQAILNKSTFVFEHRVRRADGTLGWTFSRAVPLFDENGEIVEWFGAASDITDRKIAEQALRESEERFHLAASAGKVGAYSRDLQSGNDYWSPEFLAIFGYGPDEPLPLKDGIPASVHPEDRPRVLADAAARLDSAAIPEFSSEHALTALFPKQLHRLNF